MASESVHQHLLPGATNFTFTQRFENRLTLQAASLHQAFAKKVLVKETDTVKAAPS